MNNKSLSERLNTIHDKGPDKWLSRTLFETEGFDSRSILKPPAPEPPIADGIDTNPSDQMDGGGQSSSMQVFRPNPEQIKAKSDRRKAITFLRNQKIDPSSAGQNHEGRGKSISAGGTERVVSGIDSSDQYPYFSSPRLTAVNKLIKEEVERENSGHYYKEVPLISDTTTKLPGEEMFEREDLVNMPRTVQSEEDVDRLIGLLGQTKKSAFGGHQFMYPQEMTSLVNQWSGKEFNHENLISHGIHNPDISDELVEYAYNQLSRIDRDHLDRLGHSWNPSERWSTPEGLREWGTGMMRRWLQQGGADGYLDGPGMPVMPLREMAADHAIGEEEDREYWENQVRTRFPDEVFDADSMASRVRELADDPSNIVLTRHGFNQQPKNGRSLKNLFDKAESLEGNETKKRRKVLQEAKKLQGQLRRDLRNETFHDPLIDLLKKLTTPIGALPGNLSNAKKREAQSILDALGLDEDELTIGERLLTLEDYEEIIENGKLGYERLENQDPDGQISSQRQTDDIDQNAYMFGRNALTDPMRALLKIASPLNNLSVEQPRGKDSGSNRGWPGLTDMHESSVNTTTHGGALNADPGMDYLHDALARVNLFGGPGGAGAAKTAVDRIKLAGLMFATGHGGIGTGGLRNLIEDTINTMNFHVQESGGPQFPEMNQEEMDTHHKILNHLVLKTIKNINNTPGQYGLADQEGRIRDVSGEKVDLSDQLLPKRPSMFERNIKNKLDDTEEFKQDLKLNLYGDNDETWQERHGNTFVEEVQLDFLSLLV